MCTSVITPCMLHVDVITHDYITLSQPKSQPHYPVLHRKVKLSLWLVKLHSIETYRGGDTTLCTVNVTAAPVEGDRSNAHCSCSISGKGAYGSNWMGHTAGTESCGLQKHLCFFS